MGAIGGEILGAGFAGGCDGGALGTGALRVGALYTGAWDAGAWDTVTAGAEALDEALAGSLFTGGQPERPVASGRSRTRAEEQDRQYQCSLSAT